MNNSVSVLVDTNVLVDFVAGRSPYHVNADRLFALAFDGSVSIHVSASCLVTFAYVIRKYIGKPAIPEALQKLFQATQIVPVDSAVVEQALVSDFEDFEDAVENFAAQAFDIKTIITRNPKDFKTSSLEVLEPDAFIKKYHTES